MLELRQGKARGGFDFGWLNTRHSFSFGDYYDPDRMEFGSLRVLNEDIVQPGQGFGTHGHRDMEILTWVLEGALEHRDSLGTQGVIRPGKAQIMSAGTGIRHSEFNASQTDPVHLLQIWILPERQGLTPRYDQQRFEAEALQDRWCLLASRQGPVTLYQDARVSVARMSPGTRLALPLVNGRQGYVHVARGKVELGAWSLTAGDAVVVDAPIDDALVATEPSEVLCFDLA